MNFNIDFNAEYSLRKDEFNKHLEKFFTQNIFFHKPINEFQSRLYDVMKYSLIAEGKRIRPICFIEVAKLYDVDMDKILPFAYAIEMIHTYSLIHDDLPAMDDDDMRRGRPTSHIVYGEADAILAGDALLNFAHTIMLDAIVKSGFDNNMLLACREISSKAGINGMIIGQVADIMSENSDIAESDSARSDEKSIGILDFIHKNKTGALLEASFVAAARLGGASDEEINTFRNIAINTGLAFQIRDDILDVEGSTELLGKTSSDTQNNKLTYPALLGMDTCKDKVKSLLEEAIQMLVSLDYDTEFLQAVLFNMINRTK